MPNNKVDYIFDNWKPQLDKLSNYDLAAMQSQTTSIMVLHSNLELDTVRNIIFNDLLEVLNNIRPDFIPTK